MQITLAPDTIESLVFEASPPRTPGLHLSDIIKSLNQELDPKRFKREGPLPYDLFETGFTFERVLEMAFASRLPHIFRPPEIELDGILMSPDGVDPTDWTLEEYKFTSMSSVDAPESSKFWPWKVQMMAYCHGLETRKARLRAMFLNGDYRENRFAQYKVWNIEYTADELLSNWKMITGHAKAKGML